VIFELFNPSILFGVEHRGLLMHLKDAFA